MKNKRAMTSEINKRIQILEEKFEYQERMIDSLNDVIIDQQTQLNSLENQLLRLQTLLVTLQEDPPTGEEPPPPHY